MDEAPPPWRTRVLALGAGVLVLVVVLAAGVAHRLSREAEADRSVGSPGGSSSAPTSDESSTGSGPGSGYQVKPGDQEKAVASFAATLLEEGTVDEEQASCLAFQVIQTVGLQRMVDIGMFDEEMNFLNIDLTAHPDVKDAIASAALSCITPS